MSFRRLTIACLCVHIGVTSLCRDVQADVLVEGQSDCVSVPALTSRLEAVLATYKPEGRSALLVRVAVQDQKNGPSSIELSIVLPDGSQAMQRNYLLADQDCASAEELLVAVTSEFLEALPVKSWSALPVVTPEPAPRPVAPPPEKPMAAVKLDTERARLAWIGGAGMVLAADVSRSQTQLVPEGELALGLMRGSESQALSLAALVRGSVAQELGKGRFRPTALLGQVGWQRGSELRVGLGLRGGTVRVAGSGFDENFVRWLPWLEGGPLVAYRWSSVQVQAQLLASPLRHDVSIENRDDSLWLPRFRLGLGLEYELGSKIL